MVGRNMDWMKDFRPWQKLGYKEASQKQPPEVFHKKMLLNFFQNSHKNTCIGVSFLKNSKPY